MMAINYACHRLNSLFSKVELFEFMRLIYTSWCYNMLEDLILRDLE
jgi:hypothetical protein